MDQTPEKQAVKHPKAALVAMPSAVHQEQDVTRSYFPVTIRELLPGNVRRRRSGELSYSERSASKCSR